MESGVFICVTVGRRSYAGKIIPEALNPGGKQRLIQSGVVFKLVCHSVQIRIQGFRIFVVLSQLIVQRGEKIEKIFSRGVKVITGYHGAVMKVLVQNRICFSKIKTAFPDESQRHAGLQHQ